MVSEKNIPAWIRQLTRNTALDYLRKLKRDRLMLAEPYDNISCKTLNEISTASEVETREKRQPTLSGY